MGELGNPEIEARIVNQNHHVGLPGQDVGRAVREPFSEGPRMDQYLGEPDDGSVLIVLDKTRSVLMSVVHLVHQPSSPETDVRLRILGIEPPHEIGSVQIP